MIWELVDQKEKAWYNLFSSVLTHIQKHTNEQKKKKENKKWGRGIQVYTKIK